MLFFPSFNVYNFFLINDFLNQNVDFSLLHDMNITFPISPLVFAILIFSWSSIKALNPDGTCSNNKDCPFSYYHCCTGTKWCCPTMTICTGTSTCIGIGYRLHFLESTSIINEITEWHLLILSLLIKHHLSDHMYVTYVF